MPSLTRADARERSALVDVTLMEVDLDLDHGEESFESRVRISFSCNTPGSSTFLDVLPLELRSLRLNGTPVDGGDLRDGRIELAGLAAANVLEVETLMAYSHDGQ